MIFTYLVSYTALKDDNITYPGRSVIERKVPVETADDITGLEAYIAENDAAVDTFVSSVQLLSTRETESEIS